MPAMAAQAVTTSVLMLPATAVSAADESCSAVTRALISPQLLAPSPPSLLPQAAASRPVTPNRATTETREVSFRFWLIRASPVLAVGGKAGGRIPRAILIGWLVGKLPLTGRGRLRNGRQRRMLAAAHF